MFKLFIKYLNKETKTDYSVKTGVASCHFIMNKPVGNGWVYGPLTHGSQKSNNRSILV
jgi:hypothetical protein